MLPYLLAVLVLAGIFIFSREKLYADEPEKNWIAWIIAVIALTAICGAIFMLVVGFIGLFWGGEGIYTMITYGIGGLVVGCLVGLGVGMIPKVNRCFRTNRFFSYGFFLVAACVPLYFMIKHDWYFDSVFW